MTSVPDNPRTDHEVLAGSDWDLPVTDEFLGRVHRGVRRRRLIRSAAAGGALLATAGVATVAVALAGTPGTSGDGAPAPPAAASASAVGAPLDGFRIGHLPPGAAQSGADSTYTAAVTADGLRNDGPAPAPGEPRASVTMRRFDGAGASLFVTVLRPDPTGDPAVGAAEIGDRLLRWASKDEQPIRTFDVPAGTAQLFTDVGTEITTHEVVIATPDHVVVTVSGTARHTVADLEAVARGIAR